MKRAIALLAVLGTAACAAAGPAPEPLPTPAASVTADTAPPPPPPQPTAADLESDQLPPPSPQPTEKRALPPSEESASGVTLLDPGAEPRKEMRLAWKTGATTTATITIGVRAKMSSPAGALPAPDVPKLRYTVLAKVASASKDEGAELAIVVKKVEVVSGGGDDVKKAVATLAGRKGTLSLDAHGVVTDAKLDAPGDAQPVARSAIDDLRDTLVAMAPAFPDEAIGRGATWKVRTTTHASGAAVKQVVTTKLVSAKGTKIELASEVAQSADAQPMSSPGLPPESEAKLSSLTGKGTEQSTLDLAKPLPRKYRADVANDADVEVSLAGIGASMQLHTDSTTTADAK